MRFVVKIFLFWWILLFLFEYLGILWLPFKPSFPYWDTVLVGSKMPQGVWQWANFDGAHYLTIAKIGYDGFGDQVFFPFYPLLINILTRIIPNSLISGLLISNGSIFLVGLMLFRMVKERFGEDVARWSVVFLFAFPTSFFFGSVYTESLFLLLVLLAFGVNGVWKLIAAALAGATRLVGVFSGMTGFVGAFAYMSYLWWRFGKPLFFLSAQSAFSNGRAATFNSLVTPPQVVWRYIKIFASASYQHYDFWVAVLEFTAFGLGFFVLGWLSWRRSLPWRWLVFGWLAFLLPTFSGTFSSMPRYLLAVFPVFIWLAMIKNRYIRWGILGVSVILLGLLTALFTRGYWVA